MRRKRGSGNEKPNEQCGVSRCTSRDVGKLTGCLLLLWQTHNWQMFVAVIPSKKYGMETSRAAGADSVCCCNLRLRSIPCKAGDQRYSKRSSEAPATRLDLNRNKFTKNNMQGQSFKCLGSIAQYGTKSPGPTSAISPHSAFYSVSRSTSYARREGKDV